MEARGRGFLKGEGGGGEIAPYPIELSFARVTDEKTLPRSFAAPESSGNIVGRDTELGLLSGHFEKALSGQRQVIFVTGEAGLHGTNVSRVSGEKKRTTRC